MEKYFFFHSESNHSLTPTHTVANATFVAHTTATATYFQAEIFFSTRLMADDMITEKNSRGFITSIRQTHS
jgi:hypothetical protein